MKASINFPICTHLNILNQIPENISRYKTLLNLLCEVIEKVKLVCKGI